MIHLQGLHGDYGYIVLQTGATGSRGWTWTS